MFAKCVCFRYYVPKPRHDKIRAMQRSLKDETSGELDASIASGSLKELSVWPDQDVNRLQTRAVTRLGQTQTQVTFVLSPQFEEGVNSIISILMISPGEESELEFGNESEIESSIVLHQASPSPPDAVSSRWCDKGIGEIYIEGLQQNERGKPSSSIFEEPRIITNKLDSVSGLQDTISIHGLQQLAKPLGKFSLTMV